MAHKVIEYRVRQLGFCCPHGYFTTVKELLTGEITLELGVHKRTVRRWRSAFNAGQIPCASRCQCLKECSRSPTFPEPLATPDALEFPAQPSESPSD